MGTVLLPSENVLPPETEGCTEKVGKRAGVSVYVYHFLEAEEESVPPLSQPQPPWLVSGAQWPHFQYSPFLKACPRGPLKGVQLLPTRSLLCHGRGGQGHRFEVERFF